MNDKPNRFDPRRLRKARGVLSREAVAAAVGKTTQTVWNWETGKSEPAASDLAAIARLTGRPLDFFFRPSRAA